MFSIRSKVQNTSTPLPSYKNEDNEYIECNDNENNELLMNKSRIKKKRKKRKKSEIENINDDYPSAKRLIHRRVSIIGVDIDPKTTKEIIQNKDFLLCEYHSNFPNFLSNKLKLIPKNELNKNVSMKSCDNQWIISKVVEENNKIEIIYWNTSSIYNNDNRNENKNENEIKNNHPNSPLKCYMIENKFDDEIIDICDIKHIHLLYPCASSYSTLKIHNNNINNIYNNPFMPYNNKLCPLFP
eukprot:431318_1